MIILWLRLPSLTAPGPASSVPGILSSPPLSSCCVNQQLATCDCFHLITRLPVAYYLYYLSHRNIYIWIVVNKNKNRTGLELNQAKPEKPINPTYYHLREHITESVQKVHNIIFFELISYFRDICAKWYFVYI